ncbi:MAG: hybrid sensor histidine kinase/response regulator, partial [Tannerella sp.]|nr:hybrid sensor histidine kinase/response regulator [Tannerella sp.]
MQKRHFAFVFFILLFSFQAAAQPFSIRHLGIEDGLSNNYVVDIEQDGKGCVWIATEAGLNHFDGQSFTVYRTSNSKLASNELNTLLYDRENNKLWIGTQRDGVSVLDCATQEIENFTNEDVLATNDVTHFSPAAAGGIWITHYHVGITHYDRKTGRFTHFMDAEIENMKSTKWCSHDDGAGNLYVGHARDGLSIIDLKTKTARNFRHEPGNPKSLPGNDVRAICIDRQHNVWIGTDEGLALFNPQTETFICFSHDAGNPHSLIADPVYDICETGNGKLWIATGAGGISILDLRSITLVNPEAVKFHNIAPAGDPEELSSGNIRTLFQDSFGNVWIGNYGAGLDVLNNSLPVFQTIYYTTDKKGKQKNRPVWGICADGKGQVFLGSENEIAVLEDGLLKRTINLSAHLSGPFVQVCAVEQDRQGILWLGVSNEGILKFNLSNGKFEQVRLDINNLGFITFFEDADDKMWIGTLNGLYSFKDGKLGKEDSINSQLTDKIIYSMLRDGQGKLWVGTFGKGISIFDKADRLVARFETDSGFCSNAINHLYMDTGGGIWAATRNGLVYFDDTGKPGHYRLYNEEQGLVDVYIRAIQEDKNGNIWISSNGSISMWDREKQRFNNYDCRDGIPMGNFVEGSACTTPDGTIYFGSTNGVCRFRPSEFVLQRQVAPVQIIECRSLDRGIKSQEDGLLIPAGNGRIELPYGQNSFRISFSSPDFAHSGQVEYAYMIDGLASEWSNTYGDNQVTFRNLSPGEYTFRVKARLRNQAWDESHAASLSVRIHPPFWLTWYAKTCYALLLCMALLAIIRFYKYRLNLESSLEIERKESQNRQELNDERLRFYTNITHELRTPLTLILGPLEDLLNDRDLPAHYNRQIKIIHGSAVRLLNLINQILDFRKTETQNRRLTVAKGDLGCLVTETGLRYKELNRNDKVKFHIAVETEETVMYFDADVITTILSNLLSNAVKYTPEGEIRLALSSASEYTEIRVSDTGYGIS